MSETAVEQTENINRGVSALLAIVGTLMAFMYLVVGLITLNPEFLLGSLVLWVVISIDPNVGRFRHAWD